MNTAISRACEILGSQANLARALEVKPPSVTEWLTGNRPPPIERCVVIERLTNRQVMRWDLRPNDWHAIWPELIGAEGAPAIPEPEQKLAA